MTKVISFSWTKIFVFDEKNTGNLLHKKIWFQPRHALICTLIGHYLKDMINWISAYIHDDKRKYDKIGILWTVGSFWAYILGQMGRLQAAIVGTKRPKALYIHTVSKYPQYVLTFCHSTLVWQILIPIPHWQMWNYFYRGGGTEQGVTESRHLLI